MTSIMQYRFFNLASIVVVTLLILIGGIVRSSGAGMGCPDWPTCFGLWIPPIAESQLPDNYQEIYKDHGYETARFNVVKTWTEYLNRLFGALTGIVVFATFVSSIRGFRIQPWIPLLTGGALVLVGVEGWIGAKVVASNLTPWIISVHMMLAVVIVVCLILAGILAAPAPKNNAIFPSFLKGCLSISMILSMIQIFIGTRVREKVDEVIMTNGAITDRLWIADMGGWLSSHHFFAAVVAVTVGVLGIAVIQFLPHRKWVGIGLLLLILLEIGLGVGMQQWHIPPWMQPLHLVFAVLIVSSQTVILGEWWAVKYQALNPKRKI